MNDMASIRKIRPLSNGAGPGFGFEAEERASDGSATLASEDCLRGDNQIVYQQKMRVRNPL